MSFIHPYDVSNFVQRTETHANRAKITQVGAIAFGALAFVALLATIYSTTMGGGIGSNIWIEGMATMGGAGIIAMALKIVSSRHFKKKHKAEFDQKRFQQLLLGDEGCLAKYYASLKYIEDANDFIEGIRRELIQIAAYIEDKSADESLRELIYDSILTSVGMPEIEEKEEMVKKILSNLKGLAKAENRELIKQKKGPTIKQTEFSQALGALTTLKKIDTNLKLMTVVDSDSD